MAHSLVDDEIQSCIESAEPITIMLPRHQTPGRRKLNMKKKIMSMVIAAAAMALSLVGCGVDINSIGLPPNVVMEKGETQQLEIEYGTDDKAEAEDRRRQPEEQERCIKARDAAEAPRPQELIARVSLRCAEKKGQPQRIT